MRVMEGASFPTSPDHWNKVEVEVDDADFDRLCIEWGVHGVVSEVSETVRFQILSNLAQGMLLIRMHALGGLSQQEVVDVAARLRAERERLRAGLTA